jgi:Pentapeptide repeats (8 copies)
LQVLTRWAAWPRAIRWTIGGIAAVVLAAVVAWVLFVPVADWLAHHDVGSATGPLRETALDNARGRLLTLGAGLLAAGALLFTARNFLLSREGHVTDRYTKAIEQLGSDKLDVRIGGIYALERIARDSARDHPVVMEVLAAFIREHSHEIWPPKHPASLVRDPVRPDVHAALTVVSRRGAKRGVQRIDLAGAILNGANLNGADLSGAGLYNVFLFSAFLEDADLSGASAFKGRFGRAILSGADLREADLREADLHTADLSGANLNDADLTGADLTGTILSGADLNGADLSKVKWPGYVPVPEGWELDARSGRLRRAGPGSGPAEESSP